ncbi:MAG: hypothetical protein AAFX76_14185, partial [Planctomycetota bacterium]
GGTRRMTQLAFAPDAETVSAREFGRLTTWDLTTGEVRPTIALPPVTVKAGAAEPPFAVWSGGLVLTDRVVYDTVDGSRHATVTWVDGYPRINGWSSNGYVRAARPDGNRRLPFEFLADPVAVPGGPTVGARLLSPGDRVELDLSRLEADAETRRAVGRVWEDRLRERGVVVEVGGPVRLVADTTTSRATQTYRGTNPQTNRREETQVSVVSKTSTLKLVADGRVAWTRSVRKTPDLLVRREAGQSIQEAVDASRGGTGARELADAAWPDWFPDPRAEPAATIALE